METDKKICDFRHFGPFLPFYMPNNPENQNLKKNEESTWRYHHFTHVYKKSQYVCFMRYRVRQTDFFCQFGPFFALLPPNNPENQDFETMKK